jgi:S1-C subfamily serine protease
MRTTVSLALVTLLAAALGSRAAAADAADRPAPKANRRTPVVEAVEKAAPAVVSVGTTKIVKVRYWDWDFLAPRTGSQEEHGLGSGVIVHPSGYVVTNAHVINQADQILVKLTGARESEPEVPATLVAADLEHDLALLRLDKPGPYPYVAFGRSDDLMLGETVIAIGNPFGLGRTVTTGIVSALDRTIHVRDTEFKGLIQTDAAVNRGNSGGPLLNIDGEWIGVNSAIYSLSGGADGISFAVPVGDVRRFLVEALRGARFNGRWLGARFAELPDGRVAVERVFPSSPAAEAGLAPGDVVGNGDALRVCFDLLDAERGGAVTLPVAGKAGRRDVKLAFAAPPTDSIAWSRLGFRVGEIDAARAEETGFPPGAGLVVLEVRDGGPAQRVGLERGDLLQSLGGVRLATPDDLLNVLLDAEKGAARDVRLLRRTRKQFGPSSWSTSDDVWRARLVLD